MEVKFYEGIRTKIPDNAQIDDVKKIVKYDEVYIRMGRDIFLLGKVEEATKDTLKVRQSERNVDVIKRKDVLMWNYKDKFYVNKDKVIKGAEIMNRIDKIASEIKKQASANEIADALSRLFLGEYKFGLRKLESLLPMNLQNIPKAGKEYNDAYTHTYQQFLKVLNNLERDYK